MDSYTHLSVASQTEALDALRDPSAPVAEAAKATCIVGAGARDSVLASCLASLTPKMPDLADVVRAWPKLPEPVKAGNLAMVKAVRT